MIEVTLKYWSKGKFERIYVNEGRNSLGYFQRITETEARGTDTYYDRHRAAKGDTHTYTEAYSYHGPDDIRDRVIAALDVEMKDGDDWHNFNEVSKKARGGAPCTYGTTPKKDRARIRKERDSATYMI